MMLYTGVHFDWQMTTCTRRILRGWSGSPGAPCTAPFAHFGPVRYARLSAFTREFFLAGSETSPDANDR